MPGAMPRRGLLREQPRRRVNRRRSRRIRIEFGKVFFDLDDAQHRNRLRGVDRACPQSAATANMHGLVPERSNVKLQAAERSEVDGQLQGVS